ncbi:MAG: BON domain-containing protein [Acidobacteria bacterium]|nr:BON domain-containing protein [Acidobacteriota bacterium]
MSRGVLRATSADRVDAETFARARGALDRVPDLPSTVRVHVRDSVVTLTGSVRLPASRSAADDAVRHLPGVRRVVNLIVVAAPAPDPAPTEA